MVASPDGGAACDRESAIGILGGCGLDEDDAAELAALVSESGTTTLHNQVEDARKGDNRELMADGCCNAVASAVNLIDEQLEKPRLRNVRQLLEDVKTNLKTIRGGNYVHSMERLSSWF